MNEALIEVKNVSKTFATKSVFGKRKEIPVLHQISFRIYENETVALAGESGCGKTTIGRIILGVETPTDGEVFFRGREIFSNKKDPEIRKNIQMVFQDPFASLDPKMRVEDILLEPLLANRVCKGKRDGRKIVEHLLETVGLNSAHAHRYPHQFSGGQRQRIGIARALALHPDFIICDEPVSALDVSVQAQILNLLKETQKQRNLSMLFISHDLGVVRYIADRVVIMYLGRICEIGPSEEVYSHPNHPYTEYLIRSVPKMRLPKYRNKDDGPALSENSETDPRTSSSAAACPFYSRCAYRSEECQDHFPEAKEKNGVTYYCHNR